MRPFPLVSLARPENINTITFTANTIGVLPGNQLPSDRFMWGLHLLLEGRATMPATGGPTALSADGAAQLIEKITVEGYHRGRGAQERFVDLRGADLFQLGSDYQGLTQYTEPTTWSFTGSATNDFRVNYLVPFVPLGVSPYEQARYLLDNPNYDALKLSLQFGDAVSAFGAGTAPTLTAYGSTTGSPLVRVLGYFALAGPGRFMGQVPGRLFSYFTEVTGSALTTTATRVRLVDIPRGAYVRAITVKTGVKQTTTGGNNAYGSLSNTILSEIRVNRGLNNPVRYFPLFIQAREERAAWRGFRAPAGFARIDFAGHGALGEIFNARPLVAGPSGQVDFYLDADVAGAANQAAVFVWEEIRHLPR